MFTSGTPITLSTIVLLVNAIVRALWTIAGIAVVGGLAYAGFLMVTAGGDEKRFGKGKTVLWQVIIGALVIAGIGLIMNTIANFAVNPVGVLR